jgi:hypothetical protein
MTIFATTPFRRASVILLVAVLSAALASAFAGAQLADASNATVSKNKKKCKKVPVKCAPARYHLSANGTIAIQGVDPVETWSAEVDLKRQTANVCHLATQVGACYTQDGGSLTISATGTVHCGWGPGGTLTVPAQTQAVIPVQDPAEADFVLDFFVTDNTYGFRTGIQYGTLQPVNGTTYCPPGPNGEPEQFEEITWSHEGSDTDGDRPGKLGKAHSGSASYQLSDTTVHSLRWELTPKK